MIKLLTKNGCAACERAKTALNDRGKTYTVSLLNVDFDRHWIVENYPRASTYPVFLLDDQYKGSLAELTAYLNSEASNGN